MSCVTAPSGARRRGRQGGRQLGSLVPITDTSEWTLSHRSRTLAEVLLTADLGGESVALVYQRIAPEAVRMREAGLTLKVIAEHFHVDDRTVAKAVRWFRQR